jgi:hypothetical protein
MSRLFRERAQGKAAAILGGELLASVTDVLRS